MSNQSFENYALVAQQGAATDLEVAGRYAFQAAAERNILQDVIQKLSLESSDKLLEIGCGPGNLLIPLSFMVDQAFGIDNVSALNRLSRRGADAARIQRYPGNFLEMELPNQRFNKILVYSVIQYMDTVDTAFRFLSRALSLLETGGSLLLGDIPNADKKKRWSKSSAGQAAAEDWKRKTVSAGITPLSEMPVDSKLVTVDDKFVLNVMAQGRSLGFESYLFGQPSDLPFGNTREDILFCRVT